MVYLLNSILPISLNAVLRTHKGEKRFKCAAKGRKWPSGKLALVQVWPVVLSHISPLSLIPIFNSIHCHSP